MKQREFKFRFWNSKTNRMNKCDWRDYIDYLSKFFIEYDDCLPNVHLMQCTGMKGDGNMDIYEGDICRWNTARNGSTIGTIVYEQQACAFWFKWHDGAASRYKELRVNFSDGEIWLNDNIEVLGNIYEDAGLLAATPINTNANGA